MEIKWTARKKTTGTEYLPLSETGIKETTEIKGGNGTAEEPLCLRVTILNEEKESWEGVIRMSGYFPKKTPSFFLPGFLYGRNRGEAPLDVKNEFPRLREGEGNRPASSWWMVRGDRLSHPVTMAFDDGRIYGVSGSPYFISQGKKKTGWKPGKKGEFLQYAGYTCSLEEGSIGYTLGYENAPWLFVESHDVRERGELKENCFVLEPGESIEVELQLFETEAEDEGGIHRIIRAIYDRYHVKPRLAADIADAVSDISGAVFSCAWDKEDKNYYGFVFDKGEEGLGYSKLSSISWTNGLAVAVPLLLAAHCEKNEGMRQQAIDCIENIIANSLNPASGLLYESYQGGEWCNHGWWFDRIHTPGHSAYLNGQALYYIVKSWDYEKRRTGCEHTEWLTFVKKVAVKMEAEKNTEKEYPYIFSEKTGAGLEYDSLGGVWCLAALAYYSWAAGDQSFIEGMLESENHYYRSFIKKAECYGGPLDTDKAVDSEGVLAYIRAVRWLHVITGEEALLDHLRDALFYEFTFKFCYNSPIQVPPLSKLGWSSCGGSITSVANPHIHPMSSTITDEMLYYLSNREDTYIDSRLEDTIGWSCQVYNRFDREFDYGKKGWMSERFCYSEGLLAERYPDGSPASTWFALMPWACGCILEGLSGDCFESCTIAGRTE